MGELVTLDGFPLSGVTRDGIWKINSLPGWNQRPPVKRNSESRTSGDGSFKTPVFYENRLITINGRLFTKNHDYLHQAEDMLNALGHRGGVKLLVEGHGPTQWATVDPRDSPDLTAVTGNFLQFQIPLEAIDPFKYGESYTVAGSSSTPASLFHRGKVPAWPVITVTGTAAGGYTLTLNGKSVVVTQALASGSPHTIDFKTGILRAGGSVVRGGLSTANFSPINPGLPQNMTITAGLFTAKYSDTYI